MVESTVNSDQTYIENELLCSFKNHLDKQFKANGVQGNNILSKIVKKIFKTKEK